MLTAFGGGEEEGGCCWWLWEEAWLSLASIDLFVQGRQKDNNKR